MGLLFIGIGGAFGAISRFLVSRLMNNLLPLSLVPWGTIVVNVLGAFLLAFMLTSHQLKFQFSSNFLLMAGTGFLGAFTTFSTFSYEVFQLLRESPLRALFYVSVTLFVGFAATYAGIVLARMNS